MKIGIVTWFRYENYGTVLLAIALQKFLKKTKNNVELLNFELEDGKKNKKNNKVNLMKKIYLKLGRIYIWI